MCIPVNYSKNFVVLFIRFSSVFHIYKAFANSNMERTAILILIVVRTSSVIMFWFLLHLNIKIH